MTGRIVHQRGMHQELVVLAVSESGERLFVCDALNFRRNGGLVRNGRTGEDWTTWTATPFLVEAERCVER